MFNEIWHYMYKNLIVWPQKIVNAFAEWIRNLHILRVCLKNWGATDCGSVARQCWVQKSGAAPVRFWKVRLWLEWDFDRDKWSLWLIGVLWETLPPPHQPAVKPKYSRPSVTRFWVPPNPPYFKDHLVSRITLFKGSHPFSHALCLLNQGFLLQSAMKVTAICMLLLAQSLNKFVAWTKNILVCFFPP